MGFGVSGSWVLIFVGTLAAFGSLYSTTANTAEHYEETWTLQQDHLQQIQGTDVSIGSVSLVDGVNCSVDVTVENTGVTTLDLTETDLLYDNTYQVGWQAAAEIDGDNSTDIWRPGQTLSITDNNLSSAPDRIKFVSGPGVADTAEVRGLQC
jgi:flagellar protein FlaF